MGVVNVTPDSFSDGGTLYANDALSVAAAVERAAIMVQEGASIIDVGGESTRPGAEAVSVDEELSRVVPVIEALRQRFSVAVSIDTSTPQVIAAAANAGAGLINDVRALQRDGALQAAADSGLPICLMHIKGEPKTMQQEPHYDDLLADISSYFEERVLACQAVGIAREKLILDPGFGFGKTLQHNLQLLHSMQRLQNFNLPILVGMSRKSMLGNVIHKPVGERVFGGVAVAVMALERGATIVRTHDVGATVDALKMTQAVLDS
ncbi:MAG TPA: dihydropteroate synthase [Oceanospirillaceae bacterium]|nr:dihydropteroate synthase [Oceanospirillaceae bacterium]